MLVAAVCVASVILVGCGSSGGKSGDASVRTIDVEMKDIAYVPTSLDVKAGEKVKLVFHNSGLAQHDAFIGDAAAQDAHEKEMRGMGGMSHDAGKEGIIVKPGKTDSLISTFDKAATLIGCHEAGHYAAGMKIQVNVT
jgi:uncharacterized cupredoxin-like copper-binding protein